VFRLHGVPIVVGTRGVSVVVGINSKCFIVVVKQNRKYVLRLPGISVFFVGKHVPLSARGLPAAAADASCLRQPFLDDLRAAHAVAPQ